MVFGPAGGAALPRSDKQSMSVKLIGLPDNEALRAGLCYFTLHLFFFLQCMLSGMFCYSIFGEISRNCSKEILFSFCTDIINTMWLRASRGI